MAIDPQQSRRVWVKAFWGFDPKNDGYLGFTRSADRERFVKEFQDGDLVLIYGATSQETAKEKRGQALGFLEVSPVRISDRERMSELGLRRKIESGWQHRWTFAVPVKRAWEVTRKIPIKNFARKTMRPSHGRLIAARGELLTADEAARVLALPVKEVSVYGALPIAEDVVGVETSMLQMFIPSKGVTPSFGKRQYSVADGENVLYVLKLEGAIAPFLGRSAHETVGKTVCKIGYAKNPKERLDAHNAHLPPAASFRWKLWFKSRPFADASSAKIAEDELKAAFSARFESLGREFFLTGEAETASEFAR